jgi:RNA methyltransferase, TrmH family
VAEGAELVRCALEAGLPVESVYVAPEGDHDAATQAVCRRAQAAGARIFLLGPGVVERVADTVTPQPVLAVLPMPAEPAAGTAGSERPAGAADTPVWAVEPWSLVVVLVEVRDPGNAGTVLRAADASGSAAVVFAGNCVDPYNPKTVRASAGSLFHVPLVVRDEPLALAAELSSAGFRTLATVVRDGQDYADVDWSVPTALFLGNESAGLDPAVVGAADGRLAIPMEGRAESLNVGVACAVVCFEANRQRRGGWPGRVASGAQAGRHASKPGEQGYEGTAR